jgi:hypothetical protein
MQASFALLSLVQPKSPDAHLIKHFPSNHFRFLAVLLNGSGNCTMMFPVGNLSFAVDRLMSNHFIFGIVS